jgi:hypothetical protein
MEATITFLPRIKLLHSEYNELFEEILSKFESGAITKEEFNVQMKVFHWYNFLEILEVTDYPTWKKYHTQEQTMNIK